MSLKVRINPIACDAHGLCVEMLPELMRIDDWGYTIIDTSEIPPELEALAQRAASQCPTQAIVIEEVPSGV